MTIEINIQYSEETEEIEKLIEMTERALTIVKDVKAIAQLAYDVAFEGIEDEDASVSQSENEAQSLEELKSWDFIQDMLRGLLDDTKEALENEKRNEEHE